MATTAINMGGSNSSKKAKAAEMAAAAGIGMATGAGAAVVTDHVLNHEEVVEEEIVETEAAGTSTTTSTASTASQPAASQTTQTTQQAQPAQQEGPQPVTSEPAEQQTAQNTTEEEVQQPEEVDPDLIAQEIISGEEIDPTDIDAENVVNFAEVGTVYGSDGHEYAAAVITDEMGNEMTVVDIDGDSEYDVILDDDGTVACAMPGHLNVDDAELAVSSETGYIAPTEGEIASVGMDDMMQDIITA